MSALHADLALVWYLLLAFILLLVLLLDGFSLGVGMLSLFVGPEKERGLMISSVARIWHANQTWLVVLGALLFGAFPLVYGLVLSALYIPVALMLLGFIFRGVSLEYYGHTDKKSVWGLFFGLGSLAAASAQGFALGALLHGLPIAGERFAGGPWSWLSPFSLLAALTVLGAYILSGAAWLIMKTRDVLQEKALRAARAAAFFLLLTVPGLLAWSRGLHPALSRDWSAWPGLVYTSLPLGLAALCFAILVVCLAKRREGASFLLALLLLLLCVMGLVGSLFPLVLPPSLTAFQAAAAEINLEFMLWGFALMLPLMLAYNAYQYWVFRGKVEGGY